jgi:AraC-like DNA-binding protein
MSGAWRFSISSEDLCMPIVREFGWIHRRQCAPLRWHTNDGFELTCALTGSVAWQVKDGPNLQVNGGDLSITEPRIAHRGQCDVIAPVDLFYVVINPTFKHATRNCTFSISDLRELTRRLLAQGNRVVRASRDLLEMLKRLKQTCQKLTTPFAPLLVAQARAQLCQVVIAAIESFDSRQMPQVHAPIRDALKMLEREHDGSISMDALAESVGLSRSRFFVQFRAATGMTPADYLQRHRCLRAAESLKNSRADVTSIALQHGFSSSQYFSKCFRKYMGMSPTAYRRTHAAET